MQLVKRFAAGLILMSLVTATATIIVPTPAHGDDIKTVKIGNVPLPISGNVNAVVTGNVNATVSGNVALVGTPTVNLGTGNTVGINGTVQVGNSATSPLLVRDVDNPARQPFQKGVFASSLNTVVPVVTVPQGKRLVVEFFSAEAGTSPGQTVSRFFISIQENNVSLFAHIIGPSSHGPSFGQELFIASQQLRMYLDPGQALSVNAVGDGTGFAFMELSGYFVDVP